MAHLNLYENATPGGTDGTLVTGSINFDGLPYIPFSDNAASESATVQAYRIKMFALRCDTGWKANSVIPRLSISSAINQTNANNKKLSINKYGIFSDNYLNLLFTDIGAINAYSKLISGFFYFYNSNNDYYVIPVSAP